MLNVTNNIKLIAVLSLLSLLFVAFEYNGCKKKKKLKEVKNAIQLSTDSSKYWKDQYGQEHIQKQQLIASKETLDFLYKGYIDSVSTLLKIKNKQISELVKINIEYSGKGSTQIKHDTIRTTDSFYVQQSFNWRDEYFNIDGILFNDTISLKYTGEIPINYTSFWKRKHKLLGIKYGRKIYYIDVYSTNKSVKLSGLQHIKVN